MNTKAIDLPMAEVCEEVRKFGYSPTHNIRIYGEEFEVLSDPFPSDGGIAVHVKSKRSKQTRVLFLPSMVIRRTLRFVAADFDKRPSDRDHWRS